MSETELFSAYFESIALVQANFEFWLSATFAFTLAFHFTGSEMSSYFRKMLQALYIFSVLVFTMNWVNNGLLAMDMMFQIEEGNPDVVVRPLGGGWATILILALMVLGTVGALYFSIKAGYETRDGET